MDQLVQWMEAFHHLLIHHLPYLDHILLSDRGMEIGENTYSLNNDVPRKHPCDILSLPKRVYFVNFRSRTNNQQSFGTSILPASNGSNAVRPIVVSYEAANDRLQPVYQEPFAALNGPADNNITGSDSSYMKMSNSSQDDLVVHQQQHQQRLMLQGMEMAPEKGKYGVCT